MCPARRPFRSIAFLILVVVLAGVFGAAASAQVATLGSPVPEESAAPASPVPDGQEALLAWAACMRENGVDMDDPQFGVDGELTGGLGKGGKGSDADAKDETYQLATEACSDQLTTFKAPPDPEQQAEQTEQLLVWAACMREQDIDMPDPNPDGSFPDYDWKLDLKGDAYTAADAICRESVGSPGAK